MYQNNPTGNRQLRIQGVRITPITCYGMLRALVKQATWYYLIDYHDVLDCVTLKQ